MFKAYWKPFAAGILGALVGACVLALAYQAYVDHQNLQALIGWANSVIAASQKAAAAAPK